jgi:hypothetical protein
MDSFPSAQNLLDWAALGYRSTADGHAAAGKGAAARDVSLQRPPPSIRATRVVVCYPK